MSQCLALCCIVLQCVAVSPLRTYLRANNLPAAVCGSMLQYVAVCCSTVERDAAQYDLTLSLSVI